MTRKYSQKPQQFQRIARERIEKLFIEAERQFKKDSKLSNRYVHLARKISMKYKVRIRPVLQKRFCKHCYIYLVPGSNCRVRLYGHKVSYYCKACKAYMRFPYIKEKAKK